MDAVTAQLVGYGTGFASGIVNNVWSDVRQNKAFAQNKEMAQLQNQYNIQQWDRENVYNSPQAQMERYKAAGLNPNLIYGQQNFSAQSPELVGSIAPKQAAQGSPVLDTTAVTAAQQGALLEAQRENVEADTALKNAESIKTNTENEYIPMDYAIRKLLADNEIRLTDKEIEQLDQSIQESKAQAAKIAQDTEYIKKQVEHYDEFVKAQIDQLTSNAKLSRAEAMEIYKLVEQKAQLLVAQTGEANASKWLMRSQRKLNEYDLSNMRPQELEKLTNEITDQVMKLAVEKVRTDVRSSKAFQITDAITDEIGTLVGVIVGAVLAKGGRAPKAPSTTGYTATITH